MNYSCSSVPQVMPVEVATTIPCLLVWPRLPEGRVMGGVERAHTWSKDGGNMGTARGSFFFHAITPIFLRHRPRPESFASDPGDLSLIHI